MPDEPEVIRAGQYWLAVLGFAMMRHAMAKPSLARPRVDEARFILEHLDEFPQSLEFPVSEHDVHDGYTRWAPNYDGPNMAIEREEPIVRELLADIPPGRALDAACGTGRHARVLQELGHEVAGVDTTDAMLRVARSKVPEALLCRGRLEALPLADGSVDVLTTGLAIEHVADLGPVFREFARVLRPGGHAVVSDMHPVFKMTGGIAAFPREDGSRGVPYVAGHAHQVSDYARAFIAAGFTLEACVEAIVDEEALNLFPSYRNYPDATRQAFLGLPFVLIWRLKRA